MKMFKYFLIFFLFLTLSFCVTNSNAQCSMCALNAENSVKNGNTDGSGLNNGILYLLAAPYLAIAAVGLLWYKNYRKKDVAIDIKDDKINSN